MADKFSVDFIPTAVNSDLQIIQWCAHSKQRGGEDPSPVHNGHWQPDLSLGPGVFTSLA